MSKKVVVEVGAESTLTNEIKMGILLGLRRDDGTLRPLDIVEAARTDDHPLHGEFEWDNSVAGQKYRLHQAEQLIRTVVVKVKEDSEPIRMFVSLREDREQGTGYRTVVDVLTDDDKTAQLLNETRKDAAVLLKKLAGLQKVAGSKQDTERLRKLVAALEGWQELKKAS